MRTNPTNGGPSGIIQDDRVSIDKLTQRGTDFSNSYSVKKGQ